MTPDLETAKSYFHKRYAEAPAARYGLVASSRDRVLAEWGISNDYRSTKVMRLNLGTATATSAGAPAGTCASASPSSAPGASSSTACSSPGGPTWCGSATPGPAPAPRTTRGTHVRDPFQLRVNAYRVLPPCGRE